MGSEPAELPRFAMAPGASLNDAIPIDLTDTRRPPRRAIIRVQAWPQEKREAETLELATVEGTQDALQARLDEAGYGSYRLRQMWPQMHGLTLEPHALYSLVDALQPKPPRKAKIVAKQWRCRCVEWPRRARELASVATQIDHGDRPCPPRTPPSPARGLPRPQRAALRAAWG